MPIYDIICSDCGYGGEMLAPTASAPLVCPACGSDNVAKQMSVTSSLTGRSAQAYPSSGDTACCGQSPQTAGCAGPGSCCGKRAG
ncbi:MAG: FmdB family zinc ribbon protein [Pseudomonadota bacterium]